ncbi:hypothetical protein CB1_000977020 [Camelus ferus]|nr:hypothetical protein CB1_000977020 [Camelus ferus]
MLSAQSTRMRTPRTWEKAGVRVCSNHSRELLPYSPRTASPSPPPQPHTNACSPRGSSVLCGQQEGISVRDDIGQSRADKMLIGRPSLKEDTNGPEQAGGGPADSVPLRGDRLRYPEQAGSGRTLAGSGTGRLQEESHNPSGHLRRRCRTAQLAG